MSPPGAEKLARWILEYGTTGFTGHADNELAHDRLSRVDAQNVLRAGTCVGCDLISGTWRYRFSTARIAVIVAFRSETAMVVVTAWRIKP